MIEKINQDFIAEQNEDTTKYELVEKINELIDYIHQLEQRVEFLEPSVEE